MWRKSPYLFGLVYLTGSLLLAAGLLVSFAAMPTAPGDREYQKFSECATGVPCLQITGVTGATAVPVSLSGGVTISGLPIGVTVSNTPAVTVSGTPTVSVSGTPTVDVTDRAGRLVGQVEGRAASGAAKAGNPNQVGAVFNTTQPTVTTGQAVELQATNRGAAIVATGADTFNVTVNAALPTGSNTIGALSANQSTNVAQVAGTTTDTNSGLKSAGTIRMVLATDQPALTNKLLVTPDALPANQSVNVAQMNGVATTMGNGVAGTGVQRVALASDNSAVSGVGAGATGSAVPANAVYLGGQGTANLTGITVCDTIKTISVTANTQLVTGTAAKHVYICSMNLVVAAATNVAIVSGTGAVCATGIGGVFGGTTAATGWNFAANGGIAQGNGLGWIGRTAATGDNICILVSAANQTSGVLIYTVY